MAALAGTTEQTMTAEKSTAAVISARDSDETSPVARVRRQSMRLPASARANLVRVLELSMSSQTMGHQWLVRKYS